MNGIKTADLLTSFCELQQIQCLALELVGVMKEIIRLDTLLLLLGV
jgi:hypothetical protein